MKFMEAIEELKKGNKIRLPKWEKDFHWGLTEYDEIVDDRGELITCPLAWIESDLWEVVN